MTSVYAAVIRQAAHDAVRALLTAPPDSLTGSLRLREVTTWLAAEHGAAAVTDLAEELAADLAEAFDALAAAEGRPALAVLDGWFHDVPAVPRADHGTRRHRTTPVTAPAAAIARSSRPEAGRS